MYLQGLNKKQKELFLDLSINLALADDDFSQKEMDAICLLCEEMNISKRFSANSTLEEAVRDLVNEGDKKAQKIIIVELLGIAIADDVFEKCEQNMIDKVAAAFSIGQEEVNEVSEAILDLYDTYKLLNGFIGG